MNQKQVSFEHIWARMADKEMAKRRGLLEAETRLRVNWTQFRAGQGKSWRARGEIAALLGCTTKSVDWQIRHNPEKWEKRKRPVCQVRA